LFRNHPLLSEYGCAPICAWRRRRAPLLTFSLKVLFIRRGDAKDLRGGAASKPPIALFAEPVGRKPGRLLGEAESETNDGVSIEIRLLKFMKCFLKITTERNGNAVL